MTTWRISVCAACLVAASSSAAAGLQSHGGNWTVRDGAVWVDGGQGPKLVAAGSEFTDGEAGVEVYFDDTRAGNAGLIVRVSQAGVGADAFIGYEIALDPQRGMLRLGRHRHNFSLIRDVKMAVPIKRWIPLVVRVKGDRLEVDVDGRKVATVRDKQGALPAGAVGLRPWQRRAGFRKLWFARDGKKRAVALRLDRSSAAQRPPHGPVLKGLPPIAFFTRHPFKRPFGIGTYICWDIVAKSGGGIYTCDPRVGAASRREIFRRDDGVIFDMNVSHDAKKLLFAWRATKVVSGKQDSYHIYEVDIASRRLRQLTAGRNHDVHPFYLPDGRIGFVSTRVKSYSMCQPGVACAMFTMDADGGDVRRIEFGTLSDHSPCVMPDGSILFTRWEYQDKSLTTLQGLWTVNPDGTRVQLFYGNTVTIPCVKWQAKPIPPRPGSGQAATNKMLCSLAPHHGLPIGGVGILDRRIGIENPAALTNITPDVPYKPAATSNFGPGDRQYGWSYADPWPVSEDLFLVSYGGGTGGGSPKRFRIFAMNPRGAKTLVYDDPAISCFNPLPLVPRRREPTIAHHAPAPPAAGAGSGKFLVVDVYRGLTGVPRGAVKRLRVMTTVPKRCNMRGRRMYDMDPLIGRGTYYVKHCYGTVPVREDGSAYFSAPSGTELYFSALDARGQELCRMGSVTQIMPGEYQSCIGCHEPRTQAPPNRRPQAARAEAVEITPPSWGAGTIDFARLVQPVLDKHCARCHSGSAPKAKLDLSGDKTRYFSQAYDHLTNRRLVNYFWLLRAPVGKFRPLTTGSRVSKLIQHLEKGHQKVKLGDQDRRRIYTWIEANVPYYGTYDHTRPGTPGSRDAWVGPWHGKFTRVWKSRCAACHGGQPKDTWINLTRPKFSRALNAPLAKSAGGLQLCKPKGKRQPPNFAGKTDPDYAAMLAAIEEGRAALYNRPRMDMPGGKPLPYPQDFGGLYTGFAGP